MQEQYSTLASAIVKHQETIVGPVAWSEAAKVAGLVVKGHEASVSGDGKHVIGGLVSQYEKLFGQASVEACKDAIRPLQSKMKDLDLPSVLL